MCEQQGHTHDIHCEHKIDDIKTTTRHLDFDRLIYDDKYIN